MTHLRASLHLVPGWPRLLVIALPPLLALGIAAGWLISAGRGAAPPSTPVAPVAALSLPVQPGLLIHVSGAVAKPGMYRLQRGDRVYAAIAAAGGASADADPARLPNLAGRLRDGEQVRVPLKGSGGGTRAASTSSLSIASAEELAAIPGLTQQLAADVVAHREAFGDFISTRQLVTELGMVPADYQQAKKYLRP